MPTIYVGQKGSSYNIIHCDLDGETYDIIMSTVSPLRINKSNTITDNPLVTGDIVKDHSFIQAATLGMDGTLSLNDGVNTSFNTRLKQFEDLMTRIKDEGVLCEIYKVYKSKSRFQRYTSMALQSITFTEKENSLDFSLSFVQILHVDIKPKKYDSTDIRLPSGKPAETLSFTEEYLDWKAITNYVVEECKRRNLVDSALVDEIIADAEATETRMAGTLVLGGVSLVALFIPGVRWVAIAGFIGAGISAILNSAMAVDDIQQFEEIEEQASRRTKALWELTDDVEENEKNKEEFIEFTSKIAKEVLLLNQQVSLYKLNLKDDGQSYASINNRYYIFDFKKSTDKWNLNLYDMDGNLLKGNVSTKSACTSFSQIISGYRPFYTDGVVNFYLIDLKEIKGKTTGEIYFEEEETVKTFGTVRILAYVGNPTEFREEVTEIISNALEGA